MTKNETTSRPPEGRLTKIRRFFALVGVIVIILMYLATLVCAFLDKTATKSFLMASIFVTFFTAFVVYALSLALKMVDKKPPVELPEDPDEPAK